MAVTRFQDLIAWKKARILAGEVYKATRQAEFYRDFGLSSQIQRAAVAVMANIAEGFDRRNPPEFAYLLGVARGSAAEVASHIYIATDIGYIADDRSDELLAMTFEVSRILNALQASVLRAAGSPRSTPRLRPSSADDRERSRPPRNSELGTRNSQ